jgi:pimeloyl-ACP methyl ester carboxylesterase
MPSIKSNNIDIFYDSFGAKSNPAMLLVGGLGWQMTAWDEAFCNQIADAGFYVIRFDNRDAGLSTQFDEHGVPDMALIMNDMQSNRKPKVPYSLDDMAADGLGLMDTLGIERAHICGTSMGGMIVQCMAINHPDRILSMTSIGSTTGNPELPRPPQSEAVTMASAARIDNRDAAVQRAIDLNRLAGSPGFPTDRSKIVEKARAAYDRAFNAEGVSRQMAAVIAHGDRRPALRKLNVKTLIIHGTDDPLVLPTDGIDTQENILNARLLMIEGMGHEVPEGAWDRIISEIRQLVIEVVN